MDTFEKKIILIIKQRAQTLGVTQADLAKSLGVSLITIKRWYTGKGLKIANLKSLCAELGLNISELFALTEESQLESYQYTMAQEESLASNPKLLALLDLLIGGISLNQIKKRYKLEENTLLSLLLKLDKLKLIELYPNNKIKILIKGEPTWKINGPLSKKYRSQIINDFLGPHDKSNTLFLIQDYLSSDIEHIKIKIKELENLMLLANKRACFKPDEAKSFGTYISFKEYEWSVRKSLDT